MNYSLIPQELKPIAEKIEAGSRISEKDAVSLYRSSDLNALGMIANVVRERKNGNFATYVHNRYINYSNICVLSCQFCAFAAKKRDAHAFEHAVHEIIQAIAEALPLGITEVHMVGGLHPTLKKEWYLDLLRGLRALAPDLHIKAFTAIEVRHLAERIFKMSMPDTLELLREKRADETGGEIRQCRTAEGENGNPPRVPVAGRSILIEPQRKHHPADGEKRDQLIRSCATHRGPPAGVNPGGALGRGACVPPVRALPGSGAAVDPLYCAALPGASQ